MIRNRCQPIRNFHLITNVFLYLFKKVDRLNYFMTQEGNSSNSLRERKYALLCTFFPMKSHNTSKASF